MQKKISVSGDFAKKGEDIIHGSVVKILNAGQVITGQFGDQTVFSINTKNGPKNTNFNQTSINMIVDSFGDESEGYIGKEVKVWTRKDIIAGKKVEIYYFAPEGWEMDDYGDFTLNGSVPEIEYPEEEIDLNDIPY